MLERVHHSILVIPDTHQINMYVGVTLEACSIWLVLNPMNEN